MEVVMEGDIFARNVPGMTDRLRRATVGIAGCGGLGSQAAVSLVRAGIGRLILVDSDRVEAANLNRQHYVQADIGRPKVAALAAHLRAIHPGVRLDLHPMVLTPGDVAEVFREADLLIEAFDRAESKRWLIQTWCRAYPGRPIICGSGLAGCGATGALRVRSSGQIHICGDEHSDAAAGLCSARVAIVANMQANEAIALLMGEGQEAHADDQST
jgi:sulfur carrier protein ThiS adenylyltransferase